jgi:hypothetical protein
MKTPLLFFLLILNQTFAQWEIKINKNEKKISAIGEVVFSVHTHDSIVLNVSKSKLLGLDFALEGDYFKKSKKYYVLFEIDGRKIKVLSSVIEKGKLRVSKFIDLVSREKYEVQDFLKTLKRGAECVLTIKSDSSVIQGCNKLIGSENAINSVLRSNYP